MHSWLGCATQMNRTATRLLLNNLYYALFTAGMVYFGVLQRVIAGEYTLSTVVVTFIWVLSGLGVIAFDLIDIIALFKPTPDAE